MLHKFLFHYFCVIIFYLWAVHFEH